MDVIRACPHCKVTPDSVEVCGKIEHIIAFSQVCKFPKRTQQQAVARYVRKTAARMEPSWQLTNKTCECIPEGVSEKIYIAPSSVYVTLHDHPHRVHWETSKKGNRYALVEPCHI